MTGEAFKITEEKMRVFIEESQDFLDENEGSYLTMHVVEANRSEKQIARYNNDESWVNLWVPAEVKRLLTQQPGARLRLRRWLRGGVNKGSFAFEVGTPAEAALAPLGVHPAPVRPPAPIRQPSAPALAPVAPVAAPRQLAVAPVAPPSLQPMSEGRLSELEARLGWLATELSGLRAQPPQLDQRTMIAAEQALAKEVQERVQQAEGELRRLREELGAQRSELTMQRQESASMTRMLQTLQQEVGESSSSTSRRRGPSSK